jgi:hypothetical protein
MSLVQTARDDDERAQIFAAVRATLIMVSPVDKVASVVQEVAPLFTAKTRLFPTTPTRRSSSPITSRNGPSPGAGDGVKVPEFGLKATNALLFWIQYSPKALESIVGSSVVESRNSHTPLLSGAKKPNIPRVGESGMRSARCPFTLEIFLTGRRNGPSSASGVAIPLSGAAF